MKRLTAVLASVALVLLSVSGMAINASALTTIDGIVFTLDGNSAVVTDYTGSASQVTIPDTLGGKAVTAVADNAFDRNTTVTSVILPASVRTIGECAFYGCSALESVTLGGAKEIGYFAFQGCEALSEVVYCGTQTAWEAVVIASGNDVLSTASVTFTGETGTVSLLPDSVSGFQTISEGGGTVTVTEQTEGYRFAATRGWPSAYTNNGTAGAVAVDVFSDTYLNFDFTVSSGQTNIILAFGGMSIFDRLVGVSMI